MEFRAAGLIAVLGAVVLMAGSSDAISCYVCQSSITSGCSDPFTATSSKTDCTEGVNSCSKVTGSVSGYTTVTRSCGSAGGSTGCQTASVFGLSSTTCTCSGDSCNSAFTVAPAHIISLVVITLLAKFASLM